MGVNERDPHTGHLTTGHEWNGIKELNTAVPKAVWFFLVAAAVFSFAYWILMPAWPLGRTYTKGLLGSDVRKTVALELRQAAARRAVWTKRIDREDYATILSDRTLMNDVRETGHALFGNNCAACHGIAATGGPGFPDLADPSWLWGGSPAAIAETIRVGVNSKNPDSRVSQMPAFGRDGILDRASILKVATYVRSLSDPSIARGPNVDAVTAGRKIFADNCTPCHGTDARGNTGVGAPNLTDSFWLYGGDADAVYTTIYGGRQGHMPTWERRLTSTERKILTLYVLDLRGRRP